MYRHIATKTNRIEKLIYWSVCNGTMGELVARNPFWRARCVDFLNVWRQTRQILLMLLQIVVFVLTHRSYPPSLSSSPCRQQQSFCSASSQPKLCACLANMRNRSVCAAICCVAIRWKRRRRCCGSWQTVDRRCCGWIVIVRSRIVPRLSNAGTENVVECCAENVNAGRNEEDDLPLFHRGLQ